MLLFAILVMAALLMAASERFWSNPLIIFGAILCSACLWLCIGEAIKALTL